MGPCGSRTIASPHGPIGSYTDGCELSRDLLPGLGTMLIPEGISCIIYAPDMLSVADGDLQEISRHRLPDRRPSDVSIDHSRIVDATNCAVRSSRDPCQGGWDLLPARCSSGITVDFPIRID